MKKITSLFMAALLIVFAMSAAVPALAAGPVLSAGLSDVSGYPGDTVSVEFNIDQNEGLYSFWMLMYYDKGTLSLESETYNEDLLTVGDFYETQANLANDELIGPAAESALKTLSDSGVDISAKAFKVVYFESKSIADDITFTGNAAAFSFKIADGAAAGTTEIGLLPVEGNNINCDYDDLAVTANAATVTILEKDIDPPITDPGILGISIDDANVDLATDDSFDVSMYIGENDGVFGFWFLMFYEADTLRLDVAEADSGISAYGTLYDSPNDQTADQLAGPTAPLAIQRMKDGGLDPDDYRYKVIFFESNDTENDVTYTGALAHLHFTVYSDAPLGDHNIGLIPLDGYEINCAGEELATVVGSSIVHIKMSEDVPPEDDTLVFGLTDAEGFAGDEVAVDLYVYVNPGIFSLVTMFYYDADVLTLTGCTYNSDILAQGEFTETSANLTEDELSGIFPSQALALLKAAGVTTSEKNYKVVYFEGTSITENVTFEGTAATFTFKIADDAAPGDYQIGLQCVDGNIINVDGDDVKTLYSPGTVTVKEVLPPPQPEPEPEPKPEPQPEPKPEPKPEPTPTPVTPVNPVNPSTGDNINFLFIIALLAIAGIFIGSFSIYLRRKAERKD